MAPNSATSNGLIPLTAQVCAPSQTITPAASESSPFSQLVGRTAYGDTPPSDFNI